MSEFTITGIGTPILVILAILSVVSIAIILVKFTRLSGALKGSNRRKAALDALKKDGAEAALRELGPPATPADRFAARALSEIKADHRYQIDNIIEIFGNAEARACFRHIRTLETIAMISPLLGLLGTVLGMIQAFRDLEMAEGAANAALLAGGIWQALLTTAAGLIVALPAAAGAALLSARAEAAVSEIEATLSRILAIAARRQKP